MKIIEPKHSGPIIPKRCYDSLTVMKQLGGFLEQMGIREIPHEKVSERGKSYFFEQKENQFFKEEGNRCLEGECGFEGRQHHLGVRVLNVSERD